MTEFELIRKYFARLTPVGKGVHLGVGDDAALLQVPAGHELVAAVDTLVAGRHFPGNTAPGDVGWKALAVNLSDLAAMGAEPRWCLLALTLPEVDEAWLQDFAAGFAGLAAHHRVALVGGDTTRGPLSISVTALGVVPQGQALRRDGARAGDAVCVTGTLGDAAAALALAPPAAGIGNRESGGGLADLMQRLDRPQPRVATGIALRGLAHACIDLSDGLVADLGHVCEASGVGADLDAARLPASRALLTRFPSPASRLPYQTAGDDYELCVCLSPQRLAEAQSRLDLPLTVVGTITAQPGVRLHDEAGRLLKRPLSGYRHFG